MLKTAFAACFVSLFATIACASDSKGSSPSRGEAVQVDKPKATQGQSPAGADPSATPPYLFRVETFPGPKSAAEIAAEKHSEDAKAANDWAIKISTEIIAAFNVALAFVAIGQFCLLRGQSKIANRALMASHRPKIGIRRLEYEWLNSGTRTAHAEAFFYVVNKGASIAYIKDAKGIIYFRSDESALKYYFDEYSGDISDLPNSLAAGQSARVRIQSAVTYAVVAERLAMTTSNIFAAGRIVYSDETGVERTTAFLRRLKTAPQEEAGFVVVNDPEYEYED